MALIKNRYLVGFFLVLFGFSTLANAIIPFVVQGAIALAPTVARLAVGQFAAAGLATVINPTTTKTLSIPKGNRALKVSFGIASTIASAILFAEFSGYTAVDSTHCLSHNQQSKTQIKASLEASYPSPPYNAPPSYSNETASGFYYTAANAQSNGNVWGCSGSINDASDVMWLDNSTNITQAKTDKLVTDLKAFAVSNPTDFDQIVQMSDFAASQPDMLYNTASGVVTVSSDGAGSVTVSGGSSPALTLDSNNNVLVDGQSSTGSAAPPVGSPPAPPVGSPPAPPVGSTPAPPVGSPPAPPVGSPPAPTGTVSVTVLDLGAVVQAVNNSKNQGSVDAKGITDAINGKQTDCDKFPNSLGCSDLGSITNAPVIAENVTDFTAFALSPVSFVLPAAACPTPTSISMHNGGNFQLNYQVACDFVGWMRPGILAVAWFSAAMIFSGAFRSNG